MENPQPRRETQEIEVHTAQFSGPLPPPGILKSYEEIHPGITTFMLEDVRREQEIRYDLQKKDLWNDRIKIVGSILSSFFMFGVAFTAIQNDYPGYSLPFILSGMGGLIFSIMRDSFSHGD